MYFEIESESLSEPVSLDGALHQWRGGFYKGNQAFTYNQVETGWQRAKLSIGYIQRFDYEVDMNEDSADFFYRVNNKKDLTAGKVYNIDFSVRNSYAHGIHLQYQLLNQDTFKLRVGISLLQGLRLTEGAVSGSASVITQSDYDFDVGLDYYFTRDVVFNLPVTSPRGYGLGNDIDLFYRLAPKLSVSIRARDILAAIYWLKAPHINAHITSDTKTYDQDGWVKYDPVLSGKISYRNFTQTLPARIDAKWKYDWNTAFSTYATLHYYRLKSLYRLGMNYLFDSKSELDISALDTGAVSIGGRYRQFTANLTADATTYERAHMLGLMMSLRFDL